MGIKNFRDNLKSNGYNDCFKNKWLNSYDNIYIDVNFILHYCNYNTLNEKELFEKINSLIFKLVLKLKPSKRIIFFIDGPSSNSKLLTQIERRKNFKNNEGNYSSINFTPGTVFMNNIKNKFNNILKILNNLQINSYFCNKNSGESDYKIRKLIEIISNKLPNQSHIVVSNDLDMILLLSTLKNYKFTFLLTLNKNEIEIISICFIINNFLKIYKCKQNPGYEFTAINIFLGNDYFKNLYYTSYNTLWNSYKETFDKLKKGILDKNKNINSDFLIYFLNSIKTMKHKNVHKGDDQSKNFLKGYVWCLNNYLNGECNDNNYYYKYKTGAECINLVNFLKKNIKILKFVNKKTKPLDKHLFSIIVIPKNDKLNIKDLIEKPYIKFFNDNKTNNNIDINKINEIKKKYLIYKSSIEVNVDFVFS